MATMTMDFAAPRTRRVAPADRTRSAAPAPVRLTARGRLVVRLAVAVVATALAFVVLSLGQGAVVSTLSSAPVASVHHTVVVRGGETLWQIASRELPGLDPREGISRIRTLNGLAATDVLLAGETLEIPAA